MKVYLSTLQLKQAVEGVQCYAKINIDIHRLNEHSGKQLLRLSDFNGPS